MKIHLPTIQCEAGHKGSEPKIFFPAKSCVFPGKLVVWGWKPTITWCHHVISWDIIYWLVGGLEHFLFFHILGISYSQLTFIFLRGVGIPPTRYPFWRWCKKNVSIPTSYVTHFFCRVSKPGNGTMIIIIIITLWHTNIAMENHHLSWENSL